MSKQYSGDVGSYVSDAYDNMPLFPARVIGNDPDVTSDEIEEVVHYLIDWLYMVACIDTLVEKIARNWLELSTYTISSVKAMTVSPFRDIAFVMRSNKLKDEIVVIINMPVFYSTPFETFHHIQDFISKARFTIDVMSSNTLSSVDAHTSTSIARFMQSSKEMIAQTILSYAKSNSLL